MSEPSVPCALGKAVSYVKYPKADIWLEVIADDNPETIKKFKISSFMVTRASFPLGQKIQAALADRLLTGGNQAKGDVVVRLGQVPLDALELYLRAFHMQFNDIPEALPRKHDKIDTVFLAEVVQVGMKYMCLHTFAEWFNGWAEEAHYDTRNFELLKRWLYISWVLGRKEQYRLTMIEIVRRFNQSELDRISNDTSRNARFWGRETGIWQVVDSERTRLLRQLFEPFSKAGVVALPEASTKASTKASTNEAIDFDEDESVCSDSTVKFYCPDTESSRTKCEPQPCGLHHMFDGGKCTESVLDVAATLFELLKRIQSRWQPFNDLAEVRDHSTLVPGGLEAIEKVMGKEWFHVSKPQETMLKLLQEQAELGLVLDPDTAVKNARGEDVCPYFKDPYFIFSRMKHLQHEINRIQARKNKNGDSVAEPSPQKDTTMATDTMAKPSPPKENPWAVDTVAKPSPPKEKISGSEIRAKPSPPKVNISDRNTLVQPIPEEKKGSHSEGGSDSTPANNGERDKDAPQAGKTPSTSGNSPERKPKRKAQSVDYWFGAQNGSAFAYRPHPGLAQRGTPPQHYHRT